MIGSMFDNQYWLIKWIKLQKAKLRFTKYVDRYGLNGCWSWKGAISSSGYGNFAFNRITYKAHRVSYILYKGNIESGKHICHRCDNKLCVNPEHLFQCTRQENIVDRTNKNRGYIAYSEKSHFAKLTWGIVEQIRHDYNNNDISYTNLSKKYKISRNEIWNIATNRTWYDVNYKQIKRRN